MTMTESEVQDTSDKDDRPPWTDIDAMIARYDGFLIDAFGVLVDHQGALEGASDFLSRLDDEGKPWLIVTNDAARTPATAAKWYRSLGLNIGDDRVLTSSALLSDWVRAQGLTDKPCIVLGPKDARDMMQQAGVEVVSPGDARAVAIALCDEDGFPFLPAMDAVISWWMRRIDCGLSTSAALANPDLIYPKGAGDFGIAAGSVARLIEGAIRARFVDVGPLFVALGKPNKPMFDRALEKLGMRPPRHRVLMIGDTPATDIRGGNDAGLETALVSGGVSQGLHDKPDAGLEYAGGTRPTFRLRLR